MQRTLPVYGCRLCSSTSSKVENTMACSCNTVYAPRSTLLLQLSLRCRESLQVVREQGIENAFHVVEHDGKPNSPWHIMDVAIVHLFFHTGSFIERLCRLNKTPKRRRKGLVLPVGEEEEEDADAEMSDGA